MFPAYCQNFPMFLTFLETKPFMTMARASTPRPDSLALEASLFSPVIAPPNLVISGSPTALIAELPSKKKLSFNDSLPDLVNLSLSDSISNLRDTEVEKKLDHQMADLIEAQNTVDCLMRQPELYSRIAEYNEELCRRNCGLDQKILKYEIIVQDRMEKKAFEKFLDSHKDVKTSQDSISMTEEAVTKKSNSSKRQANYSDSDFDFDVSLNKKQKKNLRKMQRKKRKQDVQACKRAGGKSESQDACVCSCNCHMYILEAQKKLMDYVRCFTAR